MRALAAAELLDLWEAGTTQPRWEWASAMLRAWRPELGTGDVDALTIGERDAALLTLREQLFGPQLTGRGECPECGAPVELDLRVADLRVPTATAAHEGTAQHGNFEMRFRVPNTRDLCEAARARDVSTMREALLDRCVLGAACGGVALNVRELPATALDHVLARMSAADPEADVRLQLSCPECSHAWSEAFDIVTYLWTEVADWAQRILQDVHVIASAYGWSQADVLALSPERRARYLEMIGA